MDGVLFLSSGCHEQAFVETLADAGICDFSYTSVAGMRTDEAFRKIFYERKRSIDDGAIEELIQKKRGKALAYLAEGGTVAEGSGEMLTHLRKRYRLALASSASSRTVEVFLGKSGYGDLFEFVLDGNSVQKAKPFPDIYQLALQRLGIQPEQGVVVEDSISGVRAAASAGILVIALTGERNTEKYNHAGACAIISELKMLEALL